MSLASLTLSVDFFSVSEAYDGKSEVKDEDARVHHSPRGFEKEVGPFQRSFSREFLRFLCIFVVWFLLHSSR